MIVYFDTEAFDHLYKKIGCTSADVANLRKAVYGRRLSILLSIHTLEEMLLGRKLPPQAFAAQIKLTLSIASSRTLIKTCNRLVLDDLHSYLNSTQTARPFLPGEMQNVVADGISSLIESDGEEMEEDFVSLLDQARQDKLRFYEMLEELRDKAHHNGQSGQAVTFEQYFDANAPRLLETLLAHAGVVATPGQPELEALLGIRTVRSIICSVLAPTFDRSSFSTLKFDNLHHAISAVSVARTYVTDSRDSRRSLGCWPHEDFGVTGLAEFIAGL